MDCPLRTRREALVTLCNGDGKNGIGEAEDVAGRVAAECSPTLLFSAVAEVTTAGEIGAHFEAARNRRNEGTVLKDPQSAYSPGRRGKMWLKIKTHLPTFDCVVTAAEYGHGKRRNSLSDYTFARPRATRRC